MYIIKIGDRYDVFSLVGYGTKKMIKFILVLAGIGLFLYYSFNEKGF
jgi:hypothetical protein